MANGQKSSPLPSQKNLHRRRFLQISATLGALGGMGAMVAMGASARLSSSPSSSLKSQDNLPLTRWQGQALGAATSIELRGAGDLQPIIGQLTTKLAAWETLFSLYQENSLINRLNQRRQLAQAEIPDEFWQIIDDCAQIVRATKGRFDPTVQALWQQFARHGVGLTVNQRLAYQQSIGWSHLEKTKEGGLAFSHATTKLTLNGIAQGFITDRISELLEGQGYRDVLVNMGEYRAIGDDWPLTIASPLGVAEAAVVLQQGQALATSHRYATYFSDHDALSLDRSPSQLIIGHILDPLHDNPPLRQPKAGNYSVIANKAVIADGLSTGLSLMKTDEIEDLRTSPFAKLYGVKIILGPRQPVIIDS